MSKLYSEGNDRRGSCLLCGVREPLTRMDKKGKQWPACYQRVFHRVGWFRGDDTYEGKVCPPCRKSRWAELEEKCAEEAA